MQSLEQYLLELAEAVLAQAGGPEHGLAVHVTQVDVDLPVESRFGEGGLLEVSAPRGRLATGFDVPHARLRARFTAGGDQ